MLQSRQLMENAQILEWMSEADTLLSNVISLKRRLDEVRVGVI